MTIIFICVCTFLLSNYHALPNCLNLYSYVTSYTSEGRCKGTAQLRPPNPVRLEWDIQPSVSIELWVRVMVMVRVRADVRAPHNSDRPTLYV